MARSSRGYGFQRRWAAWSGGTFSAKTVFEGTPGHGLGLAFKAFL